MIRLAISQRVTIDAATGERRDALDQRWTLFLSACGFSPVLIPNHATTARQLLNLDSISGVLLTGGNDLSAYGGDAPERDETEHRLIDWAEQAGVPVLGVCRGMQLLQSRSGVPLVRIEGHVGSRHSLLLPDGPQVVNSFHNWGTTTTAPGWNIRAMADDGVVEAILHQDGQRAGLMWHPERESPFAPRDLHFIQQFFGRKRA